MTLLDLRRARARYEHMFANVPKRVILNPIDAMTVANDCTAGELQNTHEYTMVIGLLLDVSITVPQGTARFAVDVNSQV